MKLRIRMSIFVSSGLQSLRMSKMSAPAADVLLVRLSVRRSSAEQPNALAMRMNISMLGVLPLPQSLRCGREWS